MKKTLTVSLVILAIVAVLIFVFVLALVSWAIPKQYTTTDIADYGIYKGNYDNKSVQEFINSFFPDEIEGVFSNVTYSYRAQKNDTYAFEAYLSFAIEDEQQYKAFVQEHTADLNQQEFRYDAAYQEYVVIDEFRPSSQEYENEDIHIQYAKIGKILCCHEKQEVIFVALGVYDGGVVTTDFLCVYFDRFQIDPREYALHAIPASAK